MRKIIKIESPGSSDYDVSVCSVSSDGASQKTNKQKQTKTKQKSRIFLSFNAERKLKCDRLLCRKLTLIKLENSFFVV
jgi:hypothetical protein